MNWGDFTLSIVEHWAWPITVLIILAVVLRKGKEIAKFVKSVRYGDLEVELKQEVAAAGTTAEEVRIQRGETPSDNTNDKTARRLAEIDPSVAVISEWRRLEHAVIGLIQHNGMMRFTTPRKFIEYLGSIGKLLDAEVVLYKRLNAIRNAAVHLYFDETVSKGQAAEYSDSVGLLIDRIDAIRAEPGYITVPIPPGQSDEP